MTALQNGFKHAPECPLLVVNDWLLNDCPLSVTIPVARFMFFGGLV